MTRNSQQAAQTLADARAALAAAEAEARLAEAAYKDSLTTTEFHELEQLAQRKLSATVAVDRARAILEAAEIRQAAAAAEAAEAERQARYEAAAKLAEAASKRLRKEYPRHAAALRDLLRELAEAEIAVKAANADLPRDATPLAGPEAERSTPTLFEEVVSEKIVDLWTPINFTQPIAEELQAKVQRHLGRQRGRMKDASDTDENPATYGSVRTNSGGTMDVVLKKFRRREILPHENGRSIAPLATEVNLPPLDAGAVPYWEPAYDAHDAARQASQTLKPKPARADRVAEIQYELVPHSHAEKAA